MATEAGEDARAAVSEHGAMDRTVHLSFGDTPAEEYVRQLFADHLIHGWDLAVGIGADRTMDPEAVRECAAWYAEREEIYRGCGRDRAAGRRARRRLGPGPPARRLRPGPARLA